MSEIIPATRDNAFLLSFHGMMVEVPLLSYLRLNNSALRLRPSCYNMSRACMGGGGGGGGSNPEPSVEHLQLRLRVTKSTPFDSGP